MSENYSKELCEEKHKSIDDVLKLHNRRLNDHSMRIDILEQDGRKFRTEIKNLIKKMDDFMVTIRWGLGIFVTVSIFCYKNFIKKIKALNNKSFILCIK